jgi:hypothetical protein
MKLLAASFDSSVGFLDNSRGNQIHFVSRTELAAGEEVVLEVRFPELLQPAMLRGWVASLTERGAWIAAHDAKSMQFLVEVAAGSVSKKAQRERACPRFPVDLPAAIRVDSERAPQEFEAETLDLAAGGAFLRASEAPAVGSRVRVVLGPTPDSGEQFIMLGDVAWTGKVGDQAGFGVRFRNAHANDGVRLRQRIRKSRETGEINFGA